MASERQNMSEQERSMQAREHELYLKPLPEEANRPVKPFPVYLRETPAEPLSPTAKAILWMTGIVVAMLFLAALWKAFQPRGARPRTETDRPAARTAMLPGSFHSDAEGSRAEPPVPFRVIS
jgi:hypothetical protein